MEMYFCGDKSDRAFLLFVASQCFLNIYRITNHEKQIRLECLTLGSRKDLFEYRQYFCVLKSKSDNSDRPFGAEVFYEEKIIYPEH